MVWDFDTALWVRKLFGAIEKRAGFSNKEYLMSILSTVANIPYDISDHICGQNLDIATEKCQL